MLIKSSEHIRSTLPLIVVFLGSLVVTLAFWQVAGTNFSGEEGSDYLTFYRPVGLSIAGGRGITLADGQTPAIRYAPGFPLLLSGIFRSSSLLRISEVKALSVFTLLCTALTSVFVFCLSRIFWPALPSVIVAFVWVTNPLFLWLTREPASEIPFAMLFYLGLFLFCIAIKRKTKASPIYFFAGAVIGSSMLVRPVAIGLGLLVGAILWFVKREVAVTSRLILIAMLLLGNCAVVLPWEAWVYSRTGNTIILSTGGVSSIRDGLTYAVNLKGFRQGTAVPADVTLLMEDIKSHYNDLQSLGSVGSIVETEFLTHPLGMVELIALKAARSWYGTDSQRMELPILLLQLFYLLFVVKASREAWRHEGFQRQLVVSVWLVVLYFWGMTVVVLSIARYMIPAMGTLFLLLPALLPANLSKINSR